MKFGDGPVETVETPRYFNSQKKYDVCTHTGLKTGTHKAELKVNDSS